MNHSSYAVSYTGRRAQNEDAIFRWQHTVGPLPVTVLAVADGMGGHAAGEVASRIAIELLEVAWKSFFEKTHPPGEPELRRFARTLYADVNDNIRSYSMSDLALDGMGTTMVSAFIVGRQVLIANVGDSRAYLVTSDGVDQITRDHSVIAESLREGLISAEEALVSPYRHALTRSLDGGREATPDLFPDEGWLTLPENGFLLLCSDGLSGSISEEALREGLFYHEDLRTGCDHLVSLAYEQGSQDNISLVALEVGKAPRRLSTRSDKKKQRRPAPASRKKRLGTYWMTGLLLLGLTSLILWWPSITSRLRFLKPRPPMTVHVPDSLSFALPLTGEETLSWRLEGISTAQPVYSVQLWIPDQAQEQGYRKSAPISLGDTTVHLKELFQISKETPVPGRFAWQVRGIMQHGRPPLESPRAYLYLYRTEISDSTDTR